MIFTALPVNVGDSFLLQHNEKVILVDGGMNETHIIDLLDYENINNNHIDLLICTHYDSDHFNGILGILKSGKYSFSEIWLPEILGSIGYTLSKKVSEILHPLRKEKLLNEINLNDGIDERILSDDNQIEPNINNSFEKIDNHVLRSIALFDPRYSFIWGYDIPERFPDPFKLDATIHSVASLISSSLSTGAYIRWFKYSGKKSTQSPGFNMFSENNSQTDIVLYSYKQFFAALYLASISPINKHSLVFKYHHNGFPNVLFTADSDLEFYNNRENLEDNSIVTAPHHGAKSNDPAYTKITGKNLTFVRSDRCQLSRPGNGYLGQSNRYCTICRNMTIKQKVELVYNSTRFTSRANTCICK